MASWALLQAEVSAAAVVFSTTATAALLITGFERWLPYEAAWSKSKGDLPTDMIYAVSSLLAAPRLFDTLALATLVPMASQLSAGEALWPAELPWVLQVGLAVIIGELGSYGWHRLMHEHPLLFRLHATHHSSPRLYWLNSTRFHPLDNVLMYGLHVTPLLLFGAGESVLVGFTVWSLVHGFFQHANIDLRLGPLNYIFSMAELHRWHHSRDPEEGNHNYGSNCILWDLVFGSFYWPRQARPPTDVGLADLPKFPQGLWGQLMSPFAWPGSQTEHDER